MCNSCKEDFPGKIHRKVWTLTSLRSILANFSQVSELLAAGSLPITLWLTELPEQDGFFTVAEPQNKDVVPQKPYLLQQTFSGHLPAVDH